MKKNISINISGIIFHIEEDAYERLRDYLDSINKYFSSFDDSQEIIADIESRIAEIFLAKLNENKQVINQEDVEDLVTTMGSIKDFQAVEDAMDESYEQKEEKTEDTHWKDTSSKKLYRDEGRKLIGGVCAGIAHYFKIDPLWIRLLFVIIFFAGYGTPLIVYIIMWIVVPGNFELKEDKKMKKMYRNPDGKVLGGVATGVAAYFAIDIAVVRLLFILFAFLGGVGIIAYIVLWLILPEAKTITEKVQMEGEPVTLSNIESNIKKSLKVKDGEENIFVKILLFPFRLIATIITGLGKVLGPALLFLVDFIRVAFGVFMVFIGLVFAFCIVVLLGVFLGLFSTGVWHMMTETGFPLEIMTDTIPTFTSIAAFFAILIPCIVFILLGISLIAKRIIFNPTVGWSLFAIFIISVITLSANVPAIVYQFREDGDFKVTETYDLADKTAVITMKEIGMEGYEVTTLKLRGHDGPDYRLEQVFGAQGSSRKKAIENAQMVTYEVTLESDSIFVFDSNIKFKDDAIFRAQRLDMTLYIPFNKPFMMSDNLHHIIYHTIHRSGYRVWDMPDNIWMYTREGLKCLSCETEEGRNAERSLNGYDRELDFSNFSDIDVSSSFVVTVEQSDEYKVLVKGSERNLKDLNIYQNGDKLYIDYDRDGVLNFIKERDAIKVSITMPEIEDIELTGAAKIYLNGFKQRHMNFNLTGASFAKANIDVDELEVDLNGASEMQLEGEGIELNADITGASHLNAYGYEVKNASVEAHGASSAKVNVSNELDIEETLASSVKYKGTAVVRRERDGF